MPAPAYLIGVGCTPFGGLPAKSLKGLTHAAYEAALAIGVEKTSHPDQPEKIAPFFAEAIDRLGRGEWEAYYAAAGAVSILEGAA